MDITRAKLDDWINKLSGASIDEIQYFFDPFLALEAVKRAGFGEY